MFYTIENNLGATIKDLLLHWNSRKATTTYRGIPTDMNPVDAWTMQEIVFELKPETIIHVGMDDMGELSYVIDLLASLPAKGREVMICDSVLNIDEKKRKISTKIGTQSRIQHISYSFINDVSEDNRLNFSTYNKTRKTLVMISALMLYDDMIQILDFFSRFVSKNSYIIVQHAVNYDGVFAEDSITLNLEMSRAIDDFVSKSDGKFISDRSREDFVLTRNPKGYIKRIK